MNARGIVVVLHGTDLKTNIILSSVFIVSNRLTKTGFRLMKTSVSIDSKLLVKKYFLFLSLNLF